MYPAQELWQLLISANETGTGIPQRFLDEKAEEMRRQKEEAERVQVGSAGCGRPGCRAACVHTAACVPVTSGCELAPAPGTCPVKSVHAHRYLRLCWVAAPPAAVASPRSTGGLAAERPFSSSSSSMNYSSSGQSSLTSPASPLKWNGWQRIC